MGKRPRRRGDIQNPDYVKATEDRRAFLRKAFTITGLAGAAAYLGLAPGILAALDEGFFRPAQQTGAQAVPPPRLPGRAALRRQGMW